MKVGPQTRRKEKISASGLRQQRLSTKGSLQAALPAGSAGTSGCGGCVQAARSCWETSWLVSPPEAGLGKRRVTSAALRKPDRAPEPAEEAPAG